MMLRIEIPMLIPKEVSPNYHGSVRARIRAVKTLRTAAFYSAVDVKNRLWTKSVKELGELPFKQAVIGAEFIVRRKGLERDMDNAIAGLKPAVDGLVNAGILLSDKPPAVSYIITFPYTVDPARAPMIILTITPMADYVINQANAIAAQVAQRGSKS